MTTIFTFLRAPAATDRESFRQDVLQVRAPELLRSCPGVARMIVSLADVDPGDAEWRRPGEAHNESAVPPYDAVLETECEGAMRPELVQRIADTFGGRASELWSYSVTPMPARVDRGRIAGGQRSPGVKYIVQCRFHPDLPDSAVKRSWEHHVPLALRVHVGADIYIRYWVEETLTPGAPLVQGITELHFPTFEDMRTRWFIDAKGRADIIQDIGHFLKSGTRLYTSEYVLRR